MKKYFILLILFGFISCQDEPKYERPISIILNVEPTYENNEYHYTGTLFNLHEWTVIACELISVTDQTCDTFYHVNDFKWEFKEGMLWCYFSYPEKINNPRVTLNIEYYNKTF